MIRNLVLLFFCLFTLISCQPAVGEKEQIKETGNLLIGKWHSVKPDINQNYIFEENGKVDWIYRNQEDEDTFHLEYTFVDSMTPHFIDMRGFESGPLVGMVLYGIIEFRGKDSLIFDFQPGDSTHSRRPRTFMEDNAVVYKRVE